MRLRAKRLAPRLSLAAFLAVAPKCVVCGLAYAGLFGLGGVELCGDTPASWSAWLPIAAGTGAAVVFLWAHRGRGQLSMTS